MYGRVLGVKILIFGVLLLGMANLFFPHPRVEALRAASGRRSLAASAVPAGGADDLAGA